MWGGRAHERGVMSSERKSAFVRPAMIRISAFVWRVPSSQLRAENRRSPARALAKTGIERERERARARERDWQRQNEHSIHWMVGLEREPLRVTKTPSHPHRVINYSPTKGRYGKAQSYPHTDGSSKQPTTLHRETRLATHTHTHTHTAYATRTSTHRGHTIAHPTATYGRRGVPCRRKMHRTHDHPPYKIVHLAPFSR
jgi:hypothetical protein